MDDIELRPGTFVTFKNGQKFVVVGRSLLKGCLRLEFIQPENMTNADYNALRKKYSGVYKIETIKQVVRNG